ncbi:MAG TPA: PAS domain-containing protein [Rhodocyclaceae bacterium]|nr:PAS domain-containing protein [Rhodocyclaceae bacterium]HMV53362.1 PAS domain-containing protein [Rhodocyclaceae bacterium]HMZ83913.1 PAS domain-containing protein [Rhodocyclaceae bacterium]HNA03576.1 PAS domain-containing protein [Rhodocyclaceae bacterium]HNB77660.1 PAS domain-containing protein [Rhodocyclaceae bacterium]
MKRDITPTSVERVMREDDFIVSKTNRKGIITYGNPIFIEFSGYSEAELLGSQHNIIRHPDMPRSAFKLVWDTIETGKEMFAYVKNMSRDGGFYWVFAHITPDLDASGNIVGYTSVRRCPKRSAIDKIEPVYRQMLQAERAAGAREAMTAGTRVLLDLLEKTGMGYEELVFSL